MNDDVWSDRRVSFASQAEAYAVGRPSYPVEALRWVVPDGATRVLDVGAGTGRLTEGLLALGLEVVAVEPLAEMRAFISPDAQVLAGSAEHLPVDDATVDAVFAGQAFHWFDGPRAVAEISRVLRPGGRVGLLWNLLDDEDPWTSSLADLLDEDARTRNVVADARPPYTDAATMSTPERGFFPRTESYDVDRLVAFVHSRSRTILLADDEREQQLEAVARMAPAGTFPVRFVCEAWRGSRLADR